MIGATASSGARGDLGVRGAELLQAAERSGRAEDYAAAEVELSRANAALPDQPEVVRDLASVYGRVGRLEEAATLLTAALARHPDDAALHDKLGYVLRYAGLPEASVRAYRRAEALDPSAENRIGAQGQIAKALIYQGDLAGARAAHDEIERLLRQTAREPDEKMLFYRGVEQVYAGRAAAAARLFDAAAAVDPDSLWTAFGQAYKAGVTGDRAGLLARARRLERENVADGERRYRLVHFFALAHEPDRALRHLGAAIDAGFFNYPYIRDDRLLGALRAEPGYAPLLERARRRHLAFKTRFESRTRASGG